MGWWGKPGNRSFGIDVGQEDKEKGSRNLIFRLYTVGCRAFRYLSLVGTADVQMENRSFGCGREFEAGKGSAIQI